MNKQRQRHIVTFGVLALALGVALARQKAVTWKAWRLPTMRPATSATSANSLPGPQDVVYAMLAAARQGDVSGYLASYTGQMETALRGSLRETTPEAFAQYLRDSNAQIKGIALNEPETLNPGQVRLRAEYVYQERNEAQILYLEKAAGLWKIARVDVAERVKTPV